MLVPAKPAIVMAEVIWRMEEVPALFKVRLFLWNISLINDETKIYIKIKLYLIFIVVCARTKVLSRQGLLVCTCRVWFCP